MKKTFNRVLVLVIVVALIASAVWYIFVYDRDTVRDFLSAQAANCAKNGHFEAAAWFYDLSYQFADQDEDLAIELAEIYKSVGNYTKAEYTLVNAIADGGTAELYAALVQTYVEQDKLLDAVNMLDSIADPAIKAELDAQRPAAPTPDYAAGFYNQYISVTFTSEGGSLYVTTDGQYPSTAASSSSGTISLSGGETKVYALVVGENGLVSPLTVLNYTVGGVIEEVTISDQAVDTAIRGLLGVSTDATLLTSDLWTITEFTVPAQAQSLADLALLTQLVSLTIEDRSLDSLEFLAPMTQLKTLSISGCRVSASLSVVATLPVLQELTLKNCRISTIAELSGSPALTSIDLSGNAIGNVSALGTIPTLETIDLSDNAVSDLAALSSLSRLTWLDVSDNALTTFSPLSACTALTWLDVSHNKITSVSPASVLVNLTELHAAHNLIADCGALSSCTELTVLDLSHNSLTDLTPLSGLVKLTELNFSYNSVTTGPALPDDCALVTINGEYNQLTSLEFLDGIDALNSVYMDYNTGITTIDFLADSQNLVLVNVYGTSVTTEQANALLKHNIIVNYNPTM